MRSDREKQLQCASETSGLRGLEKQVLQEYWVEMWTGVTNYIACPSQSSILSIRFHHLQGHTTNTSLPKYSSPTTLSPFPYHIIYSSSSLHLESISPPIPALSFFKYHSWQTNFWPPMSQTPTSSHNTAAFTVLSAAALAHPSLARLPILPVGYFQN